jgi:hypothetical protein
MQTADRATRPITRSCSRPEDHEGKKRGGDRCAANAARAAVGYDRGPCDENGLLRGCQRRDAGAEAQILAADRCGVPVRRRAGIVVAVIDGARSLSMEW